MQTMNFSQITAKRQVPEHFNFLLPFYAGVADELDMSRAYIHGILKGHGHPGIKLQQKLIEVYEFLKTEQAK